jgi:hypothetical protein
VFTIHKRNIKNKPSNIPKIMEFIKIMALNPKEVLSCNGAIVLELYGNGFPEISH